MDSELTLAAILAAVVALLIISSLIRVPYPVLLVLGGIGISLAPGVESVELDPDLVLQILLPPLLYAAAFFTPLHELRRQVRPISALSIGLVLATMVTVAAAARVVLDFGWAESFVLGAVVSPTDPVSATAIAQRLKVPQRVTTIIEGESLINDATALVAYKFAVAAVVTGTFSLASATGEFFISALGGIAVGIAGGAIIAPLRRRLDNPPVEITIALFSPYFVYLPAEAIGVSGVLAAVTVGIYMGRLTSVLTKPETRIQGNGVWEILVFLLNSALFILVGLQLPDIVDGIDGIDSGQLLGYGAVIAGTVILTRILFVFPLTYIPRILSRRIRERSPTPAWQELTVIAWTGMRGAVSLAAALAIPLMTDGGDRFPHRELIIFLTFSVIVGTLLLQGLTLPPLIRRLDLDEGNERLEFQENKARVLAAEAALNRLEEIEATEDWLFEDTAERARGAYGYRRRRFGARFESTDEDPEEYEARSEQFQRLTRELIKAQRRQLLALYSDGKLDDNVLRHLERELDLEDSRLEI